MPNLNYLTPKVVKIVCALMKANFSQADINQKTKRQQHGEGSENNSKTFST